MAAAMSNRLTIIVSQLGQIKSIVILDSLKDSMMAITCKRPVAIALETRNGRAYGQKVRSASQGLRHHTNPSPLHRIERYQDRLLQDREM